ncbi:MAG TPA: alkaline phosphatase family protein [Pyrinomonadaceae bacterium]|jgi:predicted AlkP superfamily pyrophosphatase or phosphodiesterase
MTRILRQQIKPLILLVLVSVLFLGDAKPGQRRATQTSAPQSGQRGKRPRLVLLIAVDQFRYDYLERFGDLFGPNGFKRLLRDGASWTQSNYDHMPTYTAPGHATMMTGAYPAETGIVGNEWPDRSTGKNVSSVSDTTVTSLGGAPDEPASSPKRLMSSTVGDELRLASNDRSKVIGISIKDRAAILPAGRHANAAYWFSWINGNMVSSTYYFNALPNWVVAFNNTHPADKFFGKKWERLLPESEYLKRAGADAPPWENIGTVAGDTNTFPHTVTGGATSVGRAFYNALDYTPFSNDLLLSFTEQAIVNEQLGQDDDTDVLTVSFSADDYVGHRYGPYSQEVMDVTLRVDQQIGSLLDFVNARVGLSNTLVAFTADHGVAPIPEHAAALGLGGGRIRGQDVMGAIRSAINARYNPQNKTPDPTADYIYKYEYSGALRDAFTNGNIYFNYDALKRDGVSLDEITEVAGKGALMVPGIARYFTRKQLQQGATSITDPIERRALHGFYPTRSGDLVLIPEPYKYLNETITATHGSPYSYDTNVPTVIMGAGVNPGRYYEAASPADIAPTLCALLGITKPSAATGRVLIEALKK